MITRTQSDAFSFLYDIDDAASETHVIQQLRDHLVQFGIEYFIITGLPMPGGRLEPLVMATYWPDGWWDRYMSCNYITHDPVGQNCYRTHQMFDWDKAPVPEGIKVRAGLIMAEASEFGMPVGMSLPIHTEDGFQACVSFASRNKVELDPHDRSAMELLGHAVHGHLRFIRGDKLKRSGTLTDREKEVITWMAAGKTLWEVSCILAISQHTAEKHLRAAAKKLGAVNKTHAVVEAIRYGQISL